ncbi:unnamed protein product [Parajaminaea phylloscopi]
MSSHTAPKAQLYTFDGSIWASVPRLALIEKGYAPDDVDFKTVDLIKGENFAPAYLRINSKATLPTLVVPIADTMSSEVDTKFRAITNTQDVIKFLDSSRNAQILDARGENGTANPAPVLAPATVEANAIADKIITLLHAQESDPNFLLLTARTKEELQKQKGGLQGVFVKNRLEALKRFRAETVASSDSTENPRTQQQNAALVKWYDDKLAEETPLVKAYIESDPAAIESLVAAGLVAWRGTAAALNHFEATIAQSGGPFLLGGQISLVDLHAGAWLARVIAVAEGGSDTKSKSLEALEEALHHPALGQGGAGSVGPKVKVYWEQLLQRPSFSEVYKSGFH